LYELKFDAEKCIGCRTQACLTKCQHIKIDADTAKIEILKIARGVDSFVLHECVTCYACEEYCTMGNHPFFLIVEQQEALNCAPVPQPLIQRAINLGVPFRGNPEVNEINGPVLSMGAFSELKTLIQGKLFEGIPVISTDTRKMFHYFCQLMYLHYARNSIIKARLPGIINTISGHKPTDVICFHDECYGAYTSYASAFGINIPFHPIHFFEFLYKRLQTLMESVKHINMRVAYQRPCSSRLSPDKQHFVRDILELIGAVYVERDYDGENALCCAATIHGQIRKGSRKRAADIQQRNVEDMKRHGAQICVFNCPACYQTIGQKVAEAGIKPMYMSDLCRVAIGEKPALRR